MKCYKHLLAKKTFIFKIKETHHILFLRRVLFSYFKIKYVQIIESISNKRKKKLLCFLPKKKIYILTKPIQSSKSTKKKKITKSSQPYSERKKLM
jgi:hypothetical protein